MAKQDDQALDERGTDARAGRALLKRLRDQGFDADDEKFAVALGRPVEEVRGWMNESGGDARVDDDVIMKARGIARERGLAIE